MSGRTARGLLTNTAGGFFQRVDEGEGNRRWRLGQVVLDGLVDIAQRTLPKDDGLRGHR